MFNSTALPTFLFYDYETFGTSPSLDRPALFAAVRSDSDFNIVGKPEVFYCIPADDYLPLPDAVIITGIVPLEAREKGVSEADFARRIYDLFMVPNTCIVGYNNIRFDDEVTRNILYRNFYDPYAWSWKNGNSRLDLLDIVRACYALRPEGIIWPTNKDGLPKFCLEYITRANKIEHINAHDAMTDVYATIAIARLIKATQPRLFDYLLKYRYKHKLIKLINIAQMKPLVYVSGVFGALRGNTSWIAPLAWHPDNLNTLIAVDLAADITPLIELDNNTLRKQLYTSKKALEDDTVVPVPVQLVHMNKCPVLALVSALRPEDINRLNINPKYCLENLKLIRNNPSLRAKIEAIFSNVELFLPSDNVDALLYNGFFSPTDRAAMNIILKTDPHKLKTLKITFSDQRIEKLMFNYRARNYPGTLDLTELVRWMLYRKTIFTPEFLQNYSQKLDTLFVLYKGDYKKQKQLKDLRQYSQEITLIDLIDCSTKLKLPELSSIK